MAAVKYCSRRWVPWITSSKQNGVFIKCLPADTLIPTTVTHNYSIHQENIPVTEEEWKKVQNLMLIHDLHNI